MILHLGVLDVPYSQAAGKRQKKPRAGTVTTGDVAGFLENKYHVMEVFVTEHEAEVALDLESSLQGALESLLLGAPASLDAFGQATSKIEDRFRTFIDTEEMAKLGYPGVPTQAALDRRSGKKRSGRMKRRRAGTGVSFSDTGLYESSFKSWVE